MQQKVAEFQKNMHMRIIIMAGISVLCSVVLWLIPVSKTIDVGGIDTPWVSEFYAAQTVNATSYRWSHTFGQITMMGVSHGTYAVQITLRSVHPTMITLLVDGSVADTVAVREQFATYTIPVHVVGNNAGTALLEVRCDQAQLDGTRPVCVAVDAITIRPVTVLMPALWPMLCTIVVLLGMMVLVWSYVTDWRWSAGVIAAVVACAGLWPMLCIAALPYGVVAVCMLGIWRYSAMQPATPFWDGVQWCAASALVVTVRFAFQGSVGLVLADEGYLWYGAQRVLIGELPIRDFSAYEPLRYVFNALVMWVCGSQGIIAQRIAFALIEWVGLACTGIVAIQMKFSWRSISFWALVAASLFWMYPRYKIYDLMIVWLVATIYIHWLQSPTWRTALWAGVVVGFAAMLGRNHGLYVGVVGMSLLVYQWFDVVSWRQRITTAMAWGSGVVIAVVPMLLLIFVVPTFGRAYIQEVLISQSDWDLPFAWPWLSNNVSEWFFGWWYVLPLLSYGATAVYVFWQRIQRRQVRVELLLAAMLGLVYFHRVYLRADNAHLAQSLVPFFLLLIVWGAMLTRRWQIVLMLSVCVWSGYANWRIFTGSTIGIFSDSQEVTVGEDQLTVTNGTAKQLAIYNAIQHQYNPANAPFMVAPYAPAMYAIWHQRSPMYYLYGFAAADLPDAVQRHEIAGIQQLRPQYIVIDDQMQDNNKILQFATQYPLVDAYIRAHYTLVADPIVPKKMRLYVPKDS